MAAEIDSFILKFKNLLISGKIATLVIKSNNREAEVSLNVVLEKVCPPHVGQYVPNKSRDGPSRQRRRARRAAEQAAAERVVTEVSTGEEPEIQVEANEAFTVAAEKAECKIADLEKQVETFKALNVKAAEEAAEKERNNIKEEEELRNTIAVQDMIYESLKERMSYKYGSNYDDDETSEDENEIEEIVHQCEECNFIGKTSGGLKTHQKRKHRERLTSL